MKYELIDVSPEVVLELRKGGYLHPEDGGVKQLRALEDHLPMFEKGKLGGYIFGDNVKLPDTGYWWISENCVVKGAVTIDSGVYIHNDYVDSSGKSLEMTVLSSYESKLRVMSGSRINASRLVVDGTIDFSTLINCKMRGRLNSLYSTIKDSYFVDIDCKVDGRFTECTVDKTVIEGEVHIWSGVSLEGCFVTDTQIGGKGHYIECSFRNALIKCRGAIKDINFFDIDFQQGLSMEEEGREGRLTLKGDRKKQKELG